MRSGVVENQAFEVQFTPVNWPEKGTGAMQRILGWELVPTLSPIPPSLSRSFPLPQDRGPSSSFGLRSPRAAHPEPNRA